MEPQATDNPVGAQEVACSNCLACCCRLEVILMGDDDVPLRFTRQDAWGGTVMRRSSDGWCAALDRETMKCGIYSRRPFLCGEYEMGGDDCLVERAKGMDAAVIYRCG